MRMITQRAAGLPFDRHVVERQDHALLDYWPTLHDIGPAVLHFAFSVERLTGMNPGLHRLADKGPSVGMPVSVPCNGVQKDVDGHTGSKRLGWRIEQGQETFVVLAKALSLVDKDQAV